MAGAGPGTPGDLPAWSLSGCWALGWRRRALAVGELRGGGGGALLGLWAQAAGDAARSGSRAGADCWQALAQSKPVHLGVSPGPRGRAAGSAGSAYRPAHSSGPLGAFQLGVGGGGGWGGEGLWGGWVLEEPSLRLAWCELSPEGLCTRRTRETRRLCKTPTQGGTPKSPTLSSVPKARQKSAPAPRPRPSSSEGGDNARRGSDCLYTNPSARVPFPSLLGSPVGRRAPLCWGRKRLAPWWDWPGLPRPCC